MTSLGCTPSSVGSTDVVPTTGSVTVSPPVPVNLSSGVTVGVRLCRACLWIVLCFGGLWLLSCVIDSELCYDV